MRPHSALALALALGLTACATAQTTAGPRTYRLYHGITAYVSNPDGREFRVTLDLRDINIYGDGPREVLFKIYDPDGAAVVRKVIPDDGVTSKAYLPRIGGWDHELQYYALCRSLGTPPMVRWSAWSDPKRLATIAARTFTETIPGGKKGTYRILLVGERDHYATLTIDPALAYGVCGHISWLHGHGDLWKSRYFYVPKGTTGAHVAIAQPDLPRGRRFTIKAPDGTVLLDESPAGDLFETKLKFDGAIWDDKVLKLDVSDGPSDYLLRIALQRADDEYCGFAAPAVLCDDAATARAMLGGAIYDGGEVFWHPWQVRLRRWLAANKAPAGIDQELRGLETLLRRIGPSDGRDPAGWCNWGYAFGYYGCRIWRPSWLLSKNPAMPKDAWAILREALIMCGDRLSFAIGIERVNGNSFAQIPVALWYCQAATGDPINKERYNVFFERFRTEGWGEGAGISRSGDCQEHFSHDAGYGSYIVDNWLGKAGGGGTWVENGILSDTDDPRFRETFNRILNLFSYIYCKDANAYPWNGRINQGPVGTVGNNLKGPYAPKCDPGQDLTVSVNDGNEWFAARRKGYYMVTFHGRLAPEWLSNTFHGQLGFGGGIICQLTVPGKGPVLASNLAGDYGTGMHVSNWRNFHIHSIAGEMWDGRPFCSGISEHPDARMEGNVVRSSGEVRGQPLRVARQYTFNQDSIDCEAALAAPDYEHLETLWSHGRPYADVREAYEMIPFAKGRVTFAAGPGAAPADLTTEPRTAVALMVDCGGYGVRIELDKARRVKLGANSTIMIELVAPTDKPVPAAQAAIKYRLVPIAR